MAHRNSPELLCAGDPTDMSLGSKLPNGDDRLEKTPHELEVQPVAPEVDPSHFDFTEEESRRLTRRLDLRIMPLIFAGYFFNSVDRSNLSNAKSDGLIKTLGYPTNGYSIIISCFYVANATLVVPGVIMTRKIGPNRSLPLMMFGWGSMAMINTAGGPFGVFIFVRMLLGGFEAGFAASLIYYLSTFYPRSQLAKRVAVFYSCNAFAGSFSGLIAYGVFQIKAKIHGWQVLFLLEGGLTVLLSIIVFLVLPKTPATCKFLSDREKHVARMRILKDGSTAVETRLEWRRFFKPLTDWKYYCFALLAVSYGTGTNVATNFLTQIVRRFGYSVVKTNLYTVAPNAAGGIAMLITAFSSDHFRERGFHLVSALTLVIIGCLLLVGLPISDVNAGYGAVFLIALGAFTPSVIFHSWHQSNEPSEDGRAFRVGSFTFLANIGGIVAANIFQEKFAPHYVVPLGITAGVEGLALCMALFLRTWMYRDNRKRNKAQGVKWQSKDVPTEVLADGPANPSFRHFY